MADRLSPSRTKVLLHTTRLPRPTVREVALLSDLSLSATHRHLCILRDEGLVTWASNGTRRDGTLRSRVRFVPGPWDGPEAA